ncbi:trehalase family glycosidase [Barnesiella propionica]|uniref:MGH1-like glycoside hydrolase domain-containing protein n=1 Tax=Barnesiella propionica TaxID=2981781 RepID=UPI0011C83DD8|nr:trehalase family glycosidase [Barnesiella propionica]MCU6767480.1 trehalase family glycosidase [Barnesiella propionica]
MKRPLINMLALFICAGCTTAYSQHYFDTSIPNKYVEENQFLKIDADFAEPPAFEEAKPLLPEPSWPARPDVINCYWETWKKSFSNMRQVTKENGFVSPYIFPPFVNKNIFMWDGCFMTMYGRYANNAFKYIRSLDNFYCKQHKDGFICREISMDDGTDCFAKFDVSSTGPNIMPWAEWEYYQSFGDKERLKAVFSPLLAYYQWYRTYRSWPDGSYFSSGWGCGMDNQPRLPEGEQYDPRFSTGFMSWIDINMQQIFCGKILIRMAGILGRENDVKDIEDEVKMLTQYVQKNMWDDKTAFFYDRYRDGSLNYVQSIAAYWSLLADVVPADGKERFIGHLNDPKKFKRVHRVPTLSADAPGYDADGGYWRGAIWASTNYMVLKGLTKFGENALAHEIAMNHVLNVVEVFNETGKLWENYAPEAVGGRSLSEFLGWTALVPTSDLFEYIFGIRPDVPDNTLLIDVRLTDEYGVKKYPFGQGGLLDILCKKRNKETDKPSLSVQTNVPLKIILKWAGGEITKDIKPGKNKL